MARNGTQGADSAAKIEELREQLTTTAKSLTDIQSKAEKAATASASTNREGISFLGEVIWLMTRAPSHRHFFLADAEWLVEPPVALRQFRIWRKDQFPIGYASWAFVNDEVHARFQKGVRKLAPNEWKSGEHLWLIDLVAPMGGGQEMLKELKDAVFSGRQINLFGQKAN